MKHPEIIAHRGASLERPENSIAAFVRAGELGADGIELDVHLTLDGTLVVHHDSVPHPDPQSALSGRPIQTLTVGQLRTFREGGEPIPTLEEVLEEVGSRLNVYCELKGAGTAAAAVTRLDDRRWHAAVHAFDHRQIATARRLAPALPRGVLESSYHLATTASMSSVDARDLWQYWDMIDQPLVHAVHERGGRVVAWTVNDSATMRRLMELGVDAICTNDVSLARRLLVGDG